jgi:hypothetical protein
VGRDIWKEWSEEFGLHIWQQFHWEWSSSITGDSTKDALVLLLEVTNALGALDFNSSGDRRWIGNGIVFGFCFGNW